MDEDRNQQRFRVIVLGQDADTIVNRTYTFAGERIPASRVDSAIRARVARGFTPIPLSAQARLRQTAPPYYMPYVSMGVYHGIRIGLDNTIWIGLRATSEGNPWLVLDSAGVPIGRVLLPRNVLLMEASRERIWASEENADGLRSIIRFVVAG
jgi:hypothetical protein